MEKEKIRKEFWIGVAFFLLSIAYFIGSFSISSYGGYGQQTVDSKFMPRLLGLLMAALSVIHSITSYIKMRKTGEVENKETATQCCNNTAMNVEDAKNNFDEDAYVKGSDTRSIVIIGILLLFYVATFKTLGFILSSMVFLLFTMTFLTDKKKRNWLLIFALSIGVPVLVYILFVSGFKLKLPPGILDF